MPAPAGTATASRGHRSTQVMHDNTASRPADYIAIEWWYPGGRAPRQWIASGWGRTEDEAKRALQEATERGKGWIGRKVGAG